MTTDGVLGVFNNAMNGLTEEEVDAAIIALRPPTPPAATDDAGSTAGVASAPRPNPASEAAQRLAVALLSPASGAQPTSAPPADAQPDWEPEPADPTEGATDRHCLVIGDAIYDLSGPTTIGRDAEACAVSTSDRRISRRHCSIVIDPQPALIDLGSSNGTAIVRGPQVLLVADEPVALEAGDLIMTADERCIIARFESTR